MNCTANSNEVQGQPMETFFTTNSHLLESKINRRNVMNFDISLGSYTSFINEIISLAKLKTSHQICIANVHMFIEAYRDAELLKIIKNSCIITPDGRPLVWSLRLLYGIKQERVSGMDLLPDLLNRVIHEKLSVFFYGGSEELLDTLYEYLNMAYPSIKLAGYYSPPFRELAENEKIEIAEMINKSNASIVFVVLGCPKQERWMAAMKGRINATMVGIGGALAVMVGEKRRAPKWMQTYGLEWLFRFYQEPIRLFKRYTFTNFFFLYLILKELIKVKLLRHSN